MSDFRVDYLQEAKKCLRFREGQDVTQLQFWANLLGAIANATIAAVPDSVAQALEDQQDRQQAVYDHIREKLKGV
ncbi:hypothetical protein MINTMi27_15770 [Mycobacterium intracellulare]|uniref:hypothetical protein n=1 Tax=Mycobacterium intracellulare TaxID=1767 RepID=UPI001928810A|nr:hypothetical protein [Mycobacterium intracellulare]BCP41484.1 hypothetical protein MINTMi27_15770 [Mycobacterium intracellulare]